MGKRAKPEAGFGSSSSSLYFVGTKKRHESVDSMYEAVLKAQRNGRAPYWSKVTVVKDENTVSLLCNSCGRTLSARNPADSCGNHFKDSEGRLGCKITERREKQQQALYQSMVAEGHHLTTPGTDSEMPKIRRGPQVNTPKPFDYHNTANTFQKRFAAWVLKCHIPPEYLSQTDLHSALETIGGAPPSRDDVLGGWLNTLYNDEKAQILHSITMAGEFAIAMDGWKKREGESGPPVVTVNVHLPKGGTAFWKTLTRDQAALKNGEAIAIECRNIAAEIVAVSGASLQGYVFDATMATQSASLHIGQDSTSISEPLVCLPCASHTLSLLLKDLEKQIVWIHEVLNLAVCILKANQSSPALYQLLESHLTAAGMHSTSLALPKFSPARFGAKYVALKAVRPIWEALQGLCLTSQFHAVAEKDSCLKCIQDAVAQGHASGSFSRADLVIELCEPIYEAMMSSETELSRVLPMVNGLMDHAIGFSGKHRSLCEVVDESGAVVASVSGVFHRRLREKYFTSSLAGAFLLDPLNFELDGEQLHLPFSHMLGQDVNEAAVDIETLGGQAAVHDMYKTRTAGISLSGVDKLALQAIKECAMKHRQHSNGVEGAQTVGIPPIDQRRGIWRRILCQQFPALAKVASQYLAMQSRSCAVNRDLSSLGDISGLFQNPQNPSSAEKLIFLTMHDKMQNKQDLDLPPSVLLHEVLERDAAASITEEQDMQGVPAVPCGPEVPDVPDAHDPDMNDEELV